MTLQHRVVLAPLTHFRAYASHVPGPQQPSYYAKRASTPVTFLIICISHDKGGYAHIPGVYKGEQMVTDAVHAKRSYIFLQLWALGRAADANVLEKQVPPSPYVSASDITLSGQSKAPRPLTEDEVKEYIAAYAKAAGDAVHRAGFDGVEIHSANGYLVDQFLQTVFNKCTDRWGGDEEGRTKFAREIVTAVVDTVGEDRVGFRISPWSSYQDMKMENSQPTFAYLATALHDKHPRMAYLHAVEARISGYDEVDVHSSEDNQFLRGIWKGGEGGEERVFITAGGHDRETALHYAERKGIS